MKKVVICAASLLLVVGCGSKKMTINTCTKQISDEASNIVYTETIESDKEVVQSISSKRELTFNENGEVLAMFKTYAESTKDEYNKQNGVTATLDFKENTIILDVNYDVLNMTKEELENNNLTFDSRQSLIDNYTKDGYTCE